MGLCLAQAIAPEALEQVAPVLFYLFAALTVCSAWAIVISQNIVRMSVYLLLTLGGAAGLYFLMNAEFLAAIQLIVYAGGTLILIVFGVMLTSKNPFMDLQIKLWERTVAVLLGVVLAFLLVLAMANSGLQTLERNPTAGRYDAAEIGRGLMTDYLVPFEISAVLLLVVMIGAAYMARRRTVR